MASQKTASPPTHPTLRCWHAPEKARTYNKKNTRGNLNVDHENISTHRSHHTTGAPLANKEAKMTIRTEAMEKQGKMKTNTRLDTLHNIHSQRTLTPKTRVIMSNPNIKFRDIKEITKNPRNH